MGEHKVNASNQLFVLRAAKKHRLHHTQKQDEFHLALRTCQGGNHTGHQNNATKQLDQKQVNILPLIFHTV